MWSGSEIKTVVTRLQEQRVTMDLRHSNIYILLIFLRSVLSDR